MNTPQLHDTLFSKKKKKSFFDCLLMVIKSFIVTQIKKQINTKHKPHSNADDPKEQTSMDNKQISQKVNFPSQWSAIDSTGLLIIEIKTQWSMLRITFTHLFLVICDHLTTPSLALYARSHDQSSNQFRAYIVHTQLKL